MARPTLTARRSASSRPEECRTTLTTSTVVESLVGVPQVNPGSSTMWMVAPTWVVTLQGSVLLVMTEAGLETTPQGKAARPVVVVGPLVGRLIGGALGGALDELHEASRIAIAGAASTRGRIPQTPRIRLGIRATLARPIQQADDSVCGSDGSRSSCLRPEVSFGQSELLYPDLKRLVWRDHSMGPGVATFEYADGGHDHREMSKYEANRLAMSIGLVAIQDRPDVHEWVRL